MRRSPHGSICSIIVLLGGCGGHPSGPAPVPSVSPSPGLGGTLQGGYLLRVEPVAGCAAPAAAFTFPVQAGPADTSRSRGFQVLGPGAPPALEMELQYTAPEARGGLGTTADGELAQEGFRIWVRGIGSGTVTTESGGPGEVRQGTLNGYLAFGRDGDDEGALGSCSALGHRFTLRRP